MLKYVHRKENLTEVKGMQRKIINPTNLSENLKRIRKAAGLTQEEVTRRLAEMGISITRQSYNRYENNNAGPDYSTLIALADIFNTDVNTLVGYVPKPKNSDEVVDLKKTQMIFDLITRSDITSKLEYSKDFSHFKVSMSTREYVDPDGRVRISPEGDLNLTNYQFTELLNIAKQEWDRNFPVFFVSFLRQVKDYINENKKTVDMYLAERQVEKKRITE